MERPEGFILLVCLPLGLGHAGQHSYENKKQRNFPQLRLDLPSISIGWTLSCLSDGEISMPVMLWYVIKPVNWQQLVLFTKSICSLKLIYYLNLVAAKHAGIRGAGKCVGISVSYMMGWQLGMLPCCTCCGFPCVAWATSGHVLLCLSLLWNEGSCRVGCCAVGIHSIKAGHQQCYGSFLSIMRLKGSSKQHSNYTHISGKISPSGYVLNRI